MVKSIKDLPAFEEWECLSDESVEFLKRIHVVPEKLLEYYRELTMIEQEFENNLQYEEACFINQTEPGSDLKEIKRICKEYQNWGTLCEEILDSLTDYLWPAKFRYFSGWLHDASKLNQGQCVLSAYCQEHALSYYPGEPFDHDGYEKLEANVEDKMAKILGWAERELPIEQYRIFDFALQHWEIRKPYDYHYSGDYFVLSKESFENLRAAYANMFSSEVVADIMYHNVFVMQDNGGYFCY